MRSVIEAMSAGLSGVPSQGIDSPAPGGYGTRAAISVATARSSACPTRSPARGTGAAVRAVERASVAAGTVTGGGVLAARPPGSSPGQHGDDERRRAHGQRRRGHPAPPGPRTPPAEAPVGSGVQRALEPREHAHSNSFSVSSPRLTRLRTTASETLTVSAMSL